MGSPMQFTIPQTIILEENGVERLPQFLREKKCGKVLLISDRGLERLGVVERITEILRCSEIPHTSYLDIEPNPSCGTVESVAKAYTDFGADSLIALGGGSPMDVAKAVGVLVEYGGRITGYEGAGKVPGPICPLIAIPTTAGTGSEATPFAVITNIGRNYKFSIFSYELIPCYAVLDPTLITSLPFSIAAATGIDALVHAVESYISKGGNYFSDCMAEKAMELIGRSIRLFVSDRTNISAANDMLAGSMFAGIAFGWARLGNVHAMAHPLSAYFHIPHGVANAVLLPTVLKYNALADTGRYQKIYSYLQPQKANDPFFTTQLLVDEIKALLKAFAIPEHLSELGVTEDKLEVMAQDAMKSGNILVNPRSTTVADIKALYQQAF